MGNLLQLIGDLVFANHWLGVIIRLLIALVVIWGLFVPIMSWVERRASALMQDRLGPNRVGPLGLFQVIADGIKFIVKEDVTPGRGHRFLFVIAPVIGVVVAFMAIAVIPFGYRLSAEGLGQHLILADLEVGILYILAISSLAVYTILLAGWASNNKYAMFGGVRAAAQMVSYELPLVLAILAVVILAGSARLSEIVAAQDKIWFIIPGFLAFILYFVASYAETNRSPFDMAEADSEIVGYHVEYSSMKFALFFMAEYANMVTQSMIIVCLFLGGYQFLPFISWQQLGIDLNIFWPITIVWFFAKVGFLMFTYVWIRWTVPRFRYDQLMHLAWKRMIPLGLINLAFVLVWLLYC